MKIFSSFLMILGLLVTLGGIAGLSVGAPSGGTRLGIGVALVFFAYMFRPSPKKESPSRPKRKMKGESP